MRGHSGELRLTIESLQVVSDQFDQDCQQRTPETDPEPATAARKNFLSTGYIVCNIQGKYIR